MDALILANEPVLRLGVFLGVMAAMMTWELVAPLRRLEVPRVVRWSNNLALVAVDTAILRLLFPLLAVGVAGMAQQRGWGLLNQVEWRGWLEIALAFIALDFAIWGQHVLFHKIGWLWRFHRMHHSDTAFDTTTGVRFHPGEIVISMVYKLALVVVLGASPLAVIIFEVVLNASSLFNHGNVTLGRADKVIRKLIVTPDMHRVHHSTIRAEHDRNFGFNLSLWDRLFGTYLDRPSAGQQGMTIGLDQFRERRDARLDRLLLQPFRKD